MHSNTAHLCNDDKREVSFLDVQFDRGNRGFLVHEHVVDLPCGWVFDRNYGPCHSPFPSVRGKNRGGKSLFHAPGLTSWMQAPDKERCSWSWSWSWSSWSSSQSFNSPDFMESPTSWKARERSASIAWRRMPRNREFDAYFPPTLLNIMVCSPLFIWKAPDHSMDPSPWPCCEEKDSAFQDKVGKHDKNNFRNSTSSWPWSCPWSWSSCPCFPALADARAMRIKRTVAFSFMVCGFCRQHQGIPCPPLLIKQDLTFGVRGLRHHDKSYWRRTSSLTSVKNRILRLLASAVIGLSDI